ncbi:MAG: DUF4856 domain-containing protein [Cytophagales bacterium]|nr:DUF4856 domain-containing protein [Cytophagales bacterium]
MSKLTIPVFSVLLFFIACSDDDSDGPSIEVPATYTFERDGQSTVSFSGQTTRISMGEELISAMMDFSISEAELLEMFRNETANGGDADPFDETSLNNSEKSIKRKTAASRDFFSANTTEASEIKADFEAWINGQVTEVFPNENTVASPGVAGQIADGSATRYVNGDGLEYNQLVNKSLIGALMVDQMLNNYLGVAVLDEADNRTNNDAGITATDANYTTMEHKWDEAYGYTYGLNANASDPNADLGADSFLNKYIGRVEGDDDFAGIAGEIFDAFKLGRAALVAGDYTVRDEQANIIREKISEVIAIRAVYYLQQGKIALPDDRANTALYGTTFHDLSEGYGFIYSLRFTRQPNSDAPYFTKSEVDGFLEDLLGDGANGLWDVTDSTLDNISEAIAAKFSFTVDQAGS